MSTEVRVRYNSFALEKVQQQEITVFIERPYLCSFSETYF